MQKIDSIQPSSGIREEDSKYLAYMRSISIMVIVVGHVGGFWFLPPYSEFLHVFVAVFFFISGAVSTSALSRLNATQFYAKRLPALLIPYYLLCFIVFCYSCVINASLPNFDSKIFFDWLFIKPISDESPLPVGQVWFLHALVPIVIVAPFLFRLAERSYWLISAYLFLVVILSGVEIVFKGSSYLHILGHNLFQPLVHSFFFVIGFLFIKYSNKISSVWLYVVAGLCILQSFLIVAILGVKPGYSFHTYAPDYYYVLGCIATISIGWAVRSFIVRVISQWIFLEKVFAFIFTHTFSIFLLHSIAIYIAEQVFGLTDPSIGLIVYIACKLTVVLTITCVCSIPFTYTCNFIKSLRY